MSYGSLNPIRTTHHTSAVCWVAAGAHSCPATYYGYRLPPSHLLQPATKNPSHAQPLTCYKQPPSSPAATTDSHPATGYSHPPSQPAACYSQPPSSPATCYSQPPRHPVACYSQPPSRPAASTASHPAAQPHLQPATQQPTWYTSVKNP